MTLYKNVLIVFGILFFSLNALSQEEAPKCTADKQKIDEQRKKIQTNNIHQKTKFENTLMGGTMSMEKKRTEVITYDKQGRITEWTYYKNNTRLEAIYRYTYDSRGNISELTLFSPIGDVLEKTIYSYNNAGFLTQETFFEAGNRFVSRSVYETNTSTNIITETEYSVNNTPSSKRIYYYSDLNTGDVTKREIYKQENKLYYSVERTLSQNGKVEQEDFFSSSGSMAYQFVYKYDVKGNNTEKVKYSPTRVTMQKIAIVYNNNGMEHGVTEYDRQGRIVSSVQYEYSNY